MIESWRIRYGEHIIYGEMKNAYILLSGNKNMENLGVDLRLILKLILENSL